MREPSSPCLRMTRVGAKTRPYRASQIRLNGRCRFLPGSLASWYYKYQPGRAHLKMLPTLPGRYLACAPRITSGLPPYRYKELRQSHPAQEMTILSFYLANSQHLVAFPYVHLTHNDGRQFGCNSTYYAGLIHLTINPVPKSPQSQWLEFDAY
jgi:hypothetical protein